MNDPGSSRDPVEQLAESFQASLRRGERPSLDDYVSRCPERADDIRELFPALVELEQLRPGGPTATAARAQSADANGSTARPLPPHPESLGDYQILRVVGVGGMGIVYEAEHGSLKNRVALKVMHPRFRTEPTYLRRFHTEARAAASHQYRPRLRLRRARRHLLLRHAADRGSGPAPGARRCAAAPGDR